MSRRILIPNVGVVHWRARNEMYEEIQNLTGQRFITSVIKSRRLSGAGYVARAPPMLEIKENFWQWPYELQTLREPAAEVVKKCLDECWPCWGERQTYPAVGAFVMQR